MKSNYVAGRKEMYQSLQIRKRLTVSQAASPLYVLGVLFLSEVVFHRLPACYQ